MALYQLDQVTHHYNGKTALAIDHLAIDRGSVLGLIGPNGSGKTTLLNILGLIHPPSQGRIVFDGHPAQSPTADLRHRVALLPQQAYLLHRSVRDNIAYGLRIRGISDADNRRLVEALALAGLDAAEFGPRPWFALSGGEARRVALAARLALRPQVLLLDEPTASVDDASNQIIKEAVLHAHHQWGTSLVIASHDDQWLEGICDAQLFLYRGRHLNSCDLTLIQGPWRPGAPETLVRQLSDGQVLFAPVPENVNPDATAAIESERIALHKTLLSPPAGHHVLEGTVLRLTLDKRSQRLKAAVLTGGVMITVVLAPGETHLPGQKVWLAYKMADIKWL